MNHFGWLADELTLIEEALERRADCAPYARDVRRALQRAFVEACKASRAMRAAEPDPARTCASAAPRRKQAA